MRRLGGFCNSSSVQRRRTPTPTRQPCQGKPDEGEAAADHHEVWLHVVDVVFAKTRVLHDDNDFDLDVWLAALRERYPQVGNGIDFVNMAPPDRLKLSDFISKSSE